MAFNNFTTGSEERPTLPPIHTLNLPMLSRPTHSNVKYPNHDNSLCVPVTNPRANSYHGRQVSSSSSHTSSSSRNTSPSLDSDSDTSPITSTTKFRLVPCTLEAADAAILIPPPDMQQSANYVPRQGKGKGLLLVGPALQHVRHPQRQLAKGARLHPYRIVRGPNPNNTNSRRASVISITAFSNNV